MFRTAKLRAQALEEPVYSAPAPELIAETQIHAMLQTLREDAGLSKTELARRLGVTPPAITRLEKRPAQASFNTLTRYAQACGFHLYLYYK